jgi:tyrosine decarboxylase / aspartate 1-decarboxylase
LQLHGSSKQKVLEELKKIEALDQSYEDGKILCSMCTKPHPIAKKAYNMFFKSNIGDPGLFEGSMRLEKEVIDQLASLLHGSNCRGFVVSGGTEANLLALLAARNMSQKAQPEVVLPESSHFSFNKICSMLKLKPIYAALDRSFKVDVSAVKKSLSPNTIAIVGTAGTPELGAVDPIDELAEIATGRNLYLHVDAAFGGLVIPFLPNPLNFDFNLDSVQSITIDPHKMGMAAIPAGGIIFRNRQKLDFLKTETHYLTDRYQHTLIGTRTGASVASVWAVFRHLGIEGYRKIVASCMRNITILVDGLTKAGFTLVTEPTLNIVAFRTQNTKETAEKLRGKGWFISYIPRYDCIRVVLMPHVKKRHVIAFLTDVS